MDDARAGYEPVFRVFGADAAFDGVPALVEVFLLETQRFAVGHADLFLHQVHAHHFFRDGVLHLQAGVHFQKVEVAVFVHQKFNGAGPAVVHGLCGGHGRGAHFAAQFRGEEGRGAFFHDFLVAPLHGAFAVEEVHHVAVCVAQYLELDMVRLFHELFQIDRVVAERRHGLRAGGVVGFLHLVLVVDEAHALPAAAH